LFKYCDDVCFKSKNLYNRALFIVKEQFLKDNTIIFSNELNKMLKTEDCFKKLPAKTSQQIIINMGYNWKSFFRSIKRWAKNKSGYDGKPQFPKYKKKNSRNIITIDYMQGHFENNRYYFPVRKGKERNNYIETNIQKKDFVLLRIVPYGNCYKIAIVYRKQIDEREINQNYLAIDLGINNLATLTNNIGLRPIAVNGRILKSINCYYNKLFAQASSYIVRGNSNRIQRITAKRNNIVFTHMHRISHWIINYCLENKIDNIVIGRNKDWQRNSNIGKKNNQVFVQIPFEQLIQNIQYKAEEVGINVNIVPEQYTSKASFLDDDIIPENLGDYTFSGKRIKRGLYRSNNGILINADVNGSYNILRKRNPESIKANGIKGVSLHPVRVNI
jgi:putative transposase